MEKAPANFGAMRTKSAFSKVLSFQWLKKSLLVEIIALFFVILFLYTGISKLREFSVFKAQMEESPIFGSFPSLVAWGLPTTEFIVSLLLFFPRYRLKGLYAAFILMVLFTGYVIALLSISTKLPCSCGGIMEQLSWPEHLILNSLLVVLSFVAIKMARQVLRQY